MCTYQTLAHNPFCMVIFCPDCKIYQLYFGHLILSLNKNGINQIMEVLLLKYAAYAAVEPNRDFKNIFIDTEFKGLRMCFTINEIGDLIALLQESMISHFEVSCLSED